MLQRHGIEEEQRLVTSFQQVPFLLPDHRRQLLQVADEQELNAAEGLGAVTQASQHVVHGIEQVGAHHRHLVDNEQVHAALEAAAGAAVEVVYVRKGEQRQTTLLPVWDTQNAQWRAGMWVRDSSAGVGTLTFVDAQAGVFAGLGHPISDSDTGEQVALRSGEIVACQIVGCTGGTAGSPGELKGKFISDHALGRICINGENGVYGTVSTAIAGQQTELAFAQEVLPGAAEILTTTNGETPRSYRVYIEKVNDADPRRNMVLRVTDPALLAQTGGIVQGMSGSPILQNGRLVGAVTHVLVNDPTRGYGIFAQTMLEQAHSVSGTDAAA